MFNRTRKMIRLAVVGSAAYYLYKEKPEKVKAVVNQILPESVKKEIRSTRSQYAALQEIRDTLAEMTDGISEDMLHAASNTAESLLKSLQTKDVQDQMEEIQELREQQKKHPEQFVPDTFTPHEVELLMAELPEDRMGWSIRLMLKTGINMYEVLALTPHSIQADGSVIRVTQELRTKNGEQVLVPVKSDRNRMIPVPQEVRPYAKRLRRTEDAFVWQSPDSDLPVKPSEFTSQFKDHIGEVPQVRIFGPKVAVNTYEASRENR